MNFKMKVYYFLDIGLLEGELEELFVFLRVVGREIKKEGRGEGEGGREEEKEGERKEGWEREERKEMGRWGGRGEEDEIYCFLGRDFVVIVSYI